MMNRFTKALKRLSVIVPQDDWTEDDIEHSRAIIDALEMAEREENEKENIDMPDNMLDIKRFLEKSYPIGTISISDPKTLGLPGEWEPFGDTGDSEYYYRRVK